MGLEVLLMFRDVRLHRLFVQLKPPFRDRNVSFTGHFVANPATNVTKKERGIRPKCKKQENTTVMNEQKRTI